MHWNSSVRPKTYLAFVVDEFGNFEGLVSIRDIMEEIAGKLPETGEEESEFVMLAPGGFRVSGDMLLSDLQRELAFPAAATEHYHTLAGWLLGGCNACQLPMKSSSMKAGSLL